jgi:hypothetical protein
LGFDLANIEGEIFNEVRYAFTLFTGKLGLFNAFDLVILKRAVQQLGFNADNLTVTWDLRHDDRINLSDAYVASPAGEAKMDCLSHRHQPENVPNTL